MKEVEFQGPCKELASGLGEFESQWRGKQRNDTCKSDFSIKKKIHRGKGERMETN